MSRAGYLSYSHTVLLPNNPQLLLHSAISGTLKTSRELLRTLFRVLVFYRQGIGVNGVLGTICVFEIFLVEFWGADYIDTLFCLVCLVSFIPP